MSHAHIIDGTAIAAVLRARISEQVRSLLHDHGIAPRLDVVLVGEHPASLIYVANKEKQAGGAGIRSHVHRMAADSRETEVLEKVARLNADPAVHGILVQMPLPGHIDAMRLIEAVDPAKDVDGFHPLNAGRLASGRPALVPCTPAGCVRLAKSVQPDLSGAHAVVIGRSNIVGKPLAQLLLLENCTVTIAHSHSRDLPALSRQADILFAAVGRAEMVRGDWIRPGATVIDVGINRIEPHAGEKRGRLVGDVAFHEALDVAGAITPVPGGVGPMTIAGLLANTVRAAHGALGLSPPDI
jgi:methylenetetrahydrofolate dehydrogenase (NADP+)/methenyltetrahydrofolate cyclohydrolase